jgi:hypothetical protein
MSKKNDKQITFSFARAGPERLVLEASPDLILLCAECHKPIVVQHYVPGGNESEYRDARGRCWECSAKARASKDCDDTKTKTQQ